MRVARQLKPAGLWIIAWLACCAWGQTTPNIAQQIAPTGSLRAAINLGNPILAHQASAHALPTGVSVDLAQALSEKLGLSLTLIPVTSAAQSVELVTEGKADIGFFAIDPVRGQGIAYTPAYILIEGSYLVRRDSALTDNAQVDQTQHRVVVGQGSAYDLFLTRALKQAQLVRAPTSPEVVSFFLDGSYEVAAGVKQQLQADAKKYKDVRLLPGHFMVIQQAMGQPMSASPRAREFLSAFIAEMKSSGVVQKSLSKHHIDGAVVAP